MAKYTIPTVQKAESVMVWAAMKSNGAICLRRCPTRVNAAAYQAILQSAKPFIRPWCESECLVEANTLALHFAVAADGHFSKTGRRRTAQLPPPLGCAGTG